MQRWNERSRLVFFAFVLILVASTSSLSQMPLERSGDRGGMMAAPGGPVMMGTVIQVSGETMEVTTGTGEIATISLTKGTACVREVPIDSAQLKTGDAVVIEMREGNDQISALRVVTAKAGGEGHPTQQFQGRGPVTGTITGLDPLTVTLSSGDTKKIDVSGPTRYSREEALSLSALEKGARVVIIAPPVQGGGRREAKKIILLPSVAGYRQQGHPGNGQSFAGSPNGTIAKQYADSLFGFREGLLHPDIYSVLGVHWAGTGITLASWNDVERTKGRYDFSAVDNTIAFFYNQGVNLEIELRPANALYGTAFKEFTASGGKKADEYPEGHVNDYARFIKAFVERYNGDGKNDAPGSPVIKEYQFIHELPPRHAAFEQYWKANPEKYAELFSVTYSAVKESCPDCDLYLSGSFIEDFESGDHKVFFAEVFDYFKNHTIRFPTLIFDYHYWNKNPVANPTGYREHYRIMEIIRKFCRSYGYTDSQVKFVSNTGAPARSQNEEKGQAMFLVKSYAILAGEKVKKIFWAMSLDSQRERDFFAYTGLVYSNGEKKAAYRTLRMLMERMKGVDFDAVKRVEAGGRDVFIFAFAKRHTGKKLFIAWQDASPRGSDFEISVGRGTFAVVDAITGENVAEKISDGKIAVTLSDVPRYIEEK